MSSTLTIPTGAPEHEAMDYAGLRRDGISLLERLGGTIWTDFNTHDPGVTILEQLCYAITDLGYRINYGMADLLAGGETDPWRSLFSPAQILTCNPVTLPDMRKLVIDVAGVKNAWIEPLTSTDPALAYDPSEIALYLQGQQAQPPHRQALVLRGMYRILIETDDSLGLHPADILPEVNRRLQACRNLCEDFTPPVILPGQSIVVQAQIEIGVVDDPERLLAQIYDVLANAISPRIGFYTLSQMLARGKKMDQVFDGPALDHGFIDDDELARFQRKVGLRSSDLLQEVMNLPAVSAISSLQIKSGSQSEDWYLKLDEGSTPYLDIGQSLFAVAGGAIVLTRGGIVVQVDANRVKQQIMRMQEGNVREVLPLAQRDVRLAVGKERHIAQYYSLQHQFPMVYGVGTAGLPENSTPERRAQSKQLKAYLLFFDQLLANYFAQLDGAKQLFSFFSPGTVTYFSQPILDPALDLDEVCIGTPEEYAARLQAISDDPELNAGRKNRFLNHLLARFAEQFTDYSLLQYAHLRENELIADKAAFLQDYRRIGRERGTGFNYTEPTVDSDNISGLEKRLCRKLGIFSYRKRDLAHLPASDEGGFHTLEHILLRPRLFDKTAGNTSYGVIWQPPFMAQPENSDPYSHQLSFIFPDWIERFKRPDFREFIERTLREETPAHLHITIHWLTMDEMLTFERAQQIWQDASIKGRAWDPINVVEGDEAGLLNQLRLRDARDQLVQLLGIGIPYPLRDLELGFDAIVAYNQPATIRIVGAQAGVRYQLCDEDGNVIIDNGMTLEVTPSAAMAQGTVVLKTPVIQKDITFTILAIRETADHQTRLEAYLIQSVGIKAGIDATLPVAFRAQAGQVAQGASVTCNYADKLTVIVSNSQEGISYKLVGSGGDLSTPVKGNKGDIVLQTNTGFMEDAVINVLAYRTSNWRVSSQLDASLTILVRANVALGLSVAASILDYQGTTTFIVATPQASVEYRLYKRELTAADYLPDTQSGGMLIKTTEGRIISVRIPPTVTDWNNPAGYALVGSFKDKSGKLSISSGAMLEDALFIVQAIKTVNRESLQLTQTQALLVRPNAGSAVSVAQASVSAGNEGVVQVSGTQNGVVYQLRQDPGNKLINLPGYHLSNRALESMRVAVDLVVGGQGQAMLLLPTGAINAATTFNVLAIKTITGVSAQLAGKASIGISAPA